VSVDRSTLAWTLVAFFGASLAFAALNRLTADSSSAVSFGVQVAALAVLLGAVLLVVRRMR
jgi:uncharacterized membrane protein YhaH (DUF805 family)